MSKKTTQKVLKQEIEKYNRIIDLKIAKGEDYTRESKCHKRLVQNYNFVTYGKKVAVLK